MLFVGFYRDCLIIWHTTDIDFGIQSQYLISQLVDHIRNNYRMIHILGNRFSLEGPIEFSFRIDDIQVDLFTLAKLNSTFDYYRVFSLEKRRSFRALLPKIDEICAGDIHDYMVYVPCNSEKILEVRFFEHYFYQYFRQNTATGKEKSIPTLIII